MKVIEKVTDVWRLGGLMCLLLLSTMAAAGQQRIAGTVLNGPARTPVADAVVKLTGDSLTHALTARTDISGRFVFAELSPGNYTVEVSAETFHPQQLAVRLRPRDALRLDLILIPLTGVAAQVTVFGQHGLYGEGDAATVINLDREQIADLPTARSTQMPDVVTAYVSSAVAGHDNLVHLRGNELSLNTFINGVSFYDNPHQVLTPGISPEVVQSVNIFTGGFPAEFGNRFGGILDVVTRNGFDAGGHGGFTLGGGTFLRNNLSFDYGGHTERFGYFFYGQGFESLRFLNTPEAERFHDKGMGARNFGQFDYRASSSDTLRLLMSGDGTNFELPNANEDEARGRDFFERNREQTAIFSWNHTFGNSSTLATSMYERLASSRLLPTSDPYSIQAAGLRNDITFGGKSDLSLYIGSRHAIKMGVDIAGFRLREDFSFDPRENEIEVGPFDFRGRETGSEESVYFQDRIQLTRDLSADLGLRYDHYSLVVSGQELSPRVNLAYAPGDHRTVIHFSYNRFFAPPQIENLLLSTHLGVDGLPPQISRSNFFEAGVSHSFGEIFVLRLTGFRRTDRHSFENTELANVRIFAPTTFARGRAFGLEVAGQLAEIRKTGLSAYFSYTAQRAFQTGPVSGGFTVEESEPGVSLPAAFDQIHTAVAGVTERHRRSGLFVTAQFEYGSGTPASFADIDGDEHLVRLPGHFIANLYFGIDLLGHEKRSLRLQFNAENVTDRVYRIAKESEFTPVQFSPPRFLSGSLTMRF